MGACWPMYEARGRARRGRPPPRPRARPARRRARARGGKVSVASRGHERERRRLRARWSSVRWPDARPGPVDGALPGAGGVRLLPHCPRQVEARTGRSSRRRASRQPPLALDTPYLKYALRWVDLTRDAALPAIGTIGGRAWPNVVKIHVRVMVMPG